MSLKPVKSQSIIEFPVVFIVLFIFFIGIADITLFFRQVYLVQTLSDEALARLETEHSCSADLSKTTDVLSKTTHIYYGVSPDFSSTYDSGFYNFSSEKFHFSLLCRTPNTPDMLSLRYKYKGIFFFAAGTDIASNFSSNTLYY